jgi:hypothetical protein
MHSAIPCLHILSVPEWCSDYRQIACCSYMSFDWLCIRKYGTVWYHPASSRFYLTIFILCQFQGNWLARFRIRPRVLSQLIRLAVCLAWGAEFTSTSLFPFEGRRASKAWRGRITRRCCSSLKTMGEWLFRRPEPVLVGGHRKGR